MILSHHRHGQIQSSSLGSKPASFLIRRTSHLAQREIKKDNKSDLLIRLPWERHCHFGKSDSPSEATCPWLFLIWLMNKYRHRPRVHAGSAVTNDKTCVFLYPRSVAPEVSGHVLEGNHCSELHPRRWKPKSPETEIKEGIRQDISSLNKYHTPCYTDSNRTQQTISLHITYMNLAWHIWVKHGFMVEIMCGFSTLSFSFSLKSVWRLSTTITHSSNLHHTINHASPIIIIS